MPTAPETPGTKPGDLKVVGGVTWMWVGGAWVKTGTVITLPEGGNAPMRVVDPGDLAVRGREDL